MSKNDKNYPLVEDVSIKSLIKADWNYKKEAPEKIKVFTEQIRHNGQLETLLVREIGSGKYEIINGNHRLDAFIKLDFRIVKVYNCGKIDLVQAKKLAYQMNEVRTDADDRKLAQLLSDIVTDSDIDEFKLLTGLEDADLDSLMDVDLSGLDEELTETVAPVQDFGGLTPGEELEKREDKKITSAKTTSEELAKKTAQTTDPTTVGDVIDEEKRLKTVVLPKNVAYVMNSQNLKSISCPYCEEQFEIEGLNKEEE